jgi:hypothetical protein
MSVTQRFDYWRFAANSEIRSTSLQFCTSSTRYFGYGVPENTTQILGSAYLLVQKDNEILIVTTLNLWIDFRSTYCLVNNIKCSNP